MSSNIKPHNTKKRAKGSQQPEQAKATNKPQAKPSQPAEPTFPPSQIAHLQVLAASALNLLEQQEQEQETPPKEAASAPTPRDEPEPADEGQWPRWAAKAMESYVEPDDPASVDRPPSPYPAGWEEIWKSLEPDEDDEDEDVSRAKSKAGKGKEKEGGEKEERFKCYVEGCDNQRGKFFRTKAIVRAHVANKHRGVQWEKEKVETV